MLGVSLEKAILEKEVARLLKNFERWVSQRDTLNYKTTPVVKIKQPIEMWMVKPGMYYDYIARKANKIGFDFNNKFVANHNKFAIKSPI